MPAIIANVNKRPNPAIFSTLLHAKNNNCTAPCVQQIQYFKWIVYKQKKIDQ